MYRSDADGINVPVFLRSVVTASPDHKWASMAAGRVEGEFRTAFQRDLAHASLAWVWFEILRDFLLKRL